jgi:hypothetical protein
MRTTVLAYHITWTTYGTRLPGDIRGWVKKRFQGIQRYDPQLERQSRQRMAEAAVLLSVAQRAVVEDTVRRHCETRNWTLHALNARSNHVHVVVTADQDANEVMRQLKAW